MLDLDLYALFDVLLHSILY